MLSGYEHYFILCTYYTNPIVSFLTWVSLLLLLRFKLFSLLSKISFWILHVAMFFQEILWSTSRQMLFLPLHMIFFKRTFFLPSWMAANVPPILGWCLKPLFNQISIIWKTPQWCQQCIDNDKAFQYPHIQWDTDQQKEIWGYYSHRWPLFSSWFHWL